MAHVLTRDVVKEAQSTGAPSSIGDSASHSSTATAVTAISDLSVVQDIPRDFAKSPNSNLQAEASGGSDTDTSKPESRKENNGGHARSNSVKKPTSFKSVSVTKNFLAKTAVGSIPNTRITEKILPGPTTPTNSQSPKPRLVAKSALGALGARSGMTNASANSGLDGSTVWNRNRLAPPVAKTFTDEELTQRYGIHLASRLPAGEDNKESKWADIDDEDDDWVPESVQWLDGPTEPKPDLADITNTNEDSNVVDDTPTNTIITTKTILKPNNVSSPTILSPGSLTLKGDNTENLQASIKSITSTPLPAPLPAKSPWQSLPPIDKASPVTFNPAADEIDQAYDPESYPIAKEIAADDFNRAWEGERQPKRILFNSHSGLMESVGENRKGSNKDSRQTAVLQRPNQLPASKANGSEPWQPRHRTGSVSSSGRRLSSTGRPDSSGPPSASLKSWARHSPGMSNAQAIISDDGSTEPPGSAGLVEDPVAKQQVMMREKIEKARLEKQKRLQAEALEEEARKERLRKKLEALAPETSSPTVSLSPNVQKAVPVSSPPKPPVPKFEGEIAQYGMMKLHQPHPVKKSESSILNQMNHEKKLGSDKEAIAAWRTSAMPDNLSGWSSNSSGNVWGPLQSKDRPLGNGTFDTSDSSNFTRQMRPGSSTSTAPGPIAPPSGNSMLAGAQNHNNTTQQQFSSPDQTDMASATITGTVVQTIPESHSLYQSPQQRYTQSDWQALPSKLIEEDQASQAAFMTRAREYHGIKQQQKTPQQNPQVSNEGRGFQKAVFHETFVRTVPSTVLGGMPTVISASESVNVPAGYKNSTHEESPQVNGDSSATRSSRFFPKSNIAQPSDKSSSPPPPEISSLDNNTNKEESVKVHLPKIAVVKLPPKAANDSSHWQTRIDLLLRPSAKPPTRATVDSASRPPFEVSLNRPTTTVSLPSPGLNVTQLQSRDFDDDLFPQPEFGSTPTISFPSSSDLYKHLAMLPPARFGYTVSHRQREVEREFAVSKHALATFESIDGDNLDITVRLAGMEISRTVAMHVQQSRRSFSTTHSNSNSGYRGGRSLNNRKGSYGTRRGGNHQFSRRNVSTPTIVQ